MRVLAGPDDVPGAGPLQTAFLLEEPDRLAGRERLLLDFGPERLSGLLPLSPALLVGLLPILFAGLDQLTRDVPVGPRLTRQVDFESERQGLFAHSELGGDERQAV